MDRGPSTPYLRPNRLEEGGNMALLPMTAPAHPNVRLDPSAGPEPGATPANLTPPRIAAIYWNLP